MIILSLSYLVNFERKVGKMPYVGAVFLAIPFLVLNGGLPYLFKVKWAFTIYLEYIFFGAMYLYFFRKKYTNDLKAIAYTLVLLQVVGFMYEIPWFFSNSFRTITLDFPFIIRNQFFLMPLMFWKLGASLKKPVILGSGVLWVGFLIFYGLNLHFFPSWIPRLPTFALFTLILYNWVHFRRNGKKL